MWQPSCFSIFCQFHPVFDRIELFSYSPEASAFTEASVCHKGATFWGAAHPIGPKLRSHADFIITPVLIEINTPS